MIIPIDIGFSGVYELILEDTRTGLIKDHRTVHNMLLDGFVEHMANYKRSAGQAIGNCEIGDGDTVVQASDTGLSGNVLATASNSPSYDEKEGLLDYPAYRRRTFEFPAGTGTGTIREVGITGMPAYSLYTSRIVLEESLVKGEYDKLTVIYTITGKRGSSWTGTIPGGQRDGVTDIDYKVTMNNWQMSNLFHNFTTGHMIRDWPNQGYVIIGDSNADSDLTNDENDEIKGTQLFKGVPFERYFNTYTAGDSHVDMVVGFEDTQVTGYIGEVVFAISSYYIGYFRVTFNPKLDKTDTFRLYMTLRYQITRGTSSVTVTQL